MYDNTLAVAVYSANIVWPLSAKTDSWIEHMDVESRTRPTATESSLLFLGVPDWESSLPTC